jgi:RNA polymerase sigma factor (sigma-70 family)
MSELNEADRYLLEQIRGGSADGWSQFVSRYQGRLLAFARSRVRRAADVEDLVQDTLISFLKALSHFREEAGLESYLFSILRRKIIDSHRGRKASVCLLQDILAGQVQDDGAQAAATLSAPDPTASWYARRDEDRQRQKNALVAALRHVIDHFKESQNFRDLQIIELIYYCQLRNRDIAETAGVPESHVAQIKFRTLTRIRDQIAADGYESATQPPDDLLTDVWQEQRLSCLKRSTLGAYLLGTLEPPWREYVLFHLERLGCTFCRANLEDLMAKDTANHEALRRKVMESTIGFLSRAQNPS